MRMQHIIETIFLAASSAAFVMLSIWQEIHTGEPALRGLVHAGIGGLFLLHLYMNPDRPVAPLFASFAMAIGAFVEWSAQDWGLAIVLAAGAAETLCFKFPAPGAYIVIGVAQRIRCGVIDRMAFVFHAAFVSSMAIDPPTCVVQAMVSATLAFHERDSPAGVLLGLACMRACWTAWRGVPIDDVSKQPIPIMMYTVGRWPHVLSVAFYSGALFMDAWTCCAIDAFETSTRMLHTAVVVNSLIYLLPNVVYELPWLRWPLTTFPLCDATLSIYRIATTSSLLLYPRAIGAFLVAFTLHLTTQHLTQQLDVSLVESPRPSHVLNKVLNRVAMCVYAITHVAEALRSIALYKTLAIIFHYIVIVLSLAWMGLEEMDWLGLHFARVFLVVECTTSIGLFILVGDPWSILTIVCSAFLCWRMHAQKSRANMRFASSLLAFGRPVVLEEV